MIKHLLGILLLALYLPAAAGVGFSSHYCFGKLKETKVFSVAKQDCCCDEADEEEKGCCRNEIKVVKLENDQLTANQNTQVKAKSVELLYLPLSQDVQSFSTYTTKVAASVLSSPPLISRNLIIQYRSILI